MYSNLFGLFCVVFYGFFVKIPECFIGNRIPYKDYFVFGIDQEGLVERLGGQLVLPDKVDGLVVENTKFEIIDF